MKNTLLFLLFITLIVVSCTKEPAALSNDDLIFSNSLPVKIPSYTFTSGNTEYTVRGDTSYFSDEPDTLPRTPVFKWDSVKVSLIYVGIFKAPIRTENGEITNTGDLVWAWHSGLPNGRNGLVKYEDGKNVTKNGSYVYTDPTPLPGNIIYYWGVWAWNNSGTQIWFSSRPLKFFVKN